MKQRFEKVRTLNRIDNFFFHSYRYLSSKTRGVVESSFSGLLFRLLQEPVFSLFSSGQTSFMPEDVFQGKIIILDIPVLTYGKAGQIVQRLFKYVFELAMLRRNLDENNRPVVIWQDEAHLTLLEQDSNFLSTCREKRIANVMISQNISNFHQNMGGSNSEHRVSSLTSLLSTKIFHANDHPETNEWASKLIGEAYTADYSYSDTVTGEFSNTRNQSYKRERMVPPEAFLDLKSGGFAHHGLAEAYVVFQGKSFHNGFHHRKITFKQKIFNH
ncbi:MAG: TraM recognition domain-containing protein [Chitinophagaceae bacterium]